MKKIAVTVTVENAPVEAFGVAGEYADIHDNAPHRLNCARELLRHTAVQCALKADADGNDPEHVRLKAVIADLAGYVSAEAGLRVRQIMYPESAKRPSAWTIGDVFRVVGLEEGSVASGER